MRRSFYKTYFEVEPNHWWFKVRRNIVLALIEKYQKSKTAKILDFGCGSGYTAGFFQKLGYNVSGIDTSVEAIEFGRSQGVRGLKVLKPGAPKSENGQFDLVLALDVVEHIEDDLSALDNLESFLKPGGVAIITVPAYQWLWGVQDEVAHHYRRYNLAELLELVKKNGRFSVIRKSYFNTFLFPPIAVVRLLSKCFKLKKRESDFDLNDRISNSIFYLIFNLEARFLKYLDFPFGVSLLLVLRKNWVFAPK